MKRVANQDDDDNGSGSSVQAQSAPGHDPRNEEAAWVFGARSESKESLASFTCPESFRYAAVDLMRKLEPECTGITSYVHNTSKDGPAYLEPLMRMFPGTLRVLPPRQDAPKGTVEIRALELRVRQHDHLVIVLPRHVYLCERAIDPKLIDSQAKTSIDYYIRIISQLFYDGARKSTMIAVINTAYHVISSQITTWLQFLTRRNELRDGARDSVEALETLKGMVHALDYPEDSKDAWRGRMTDFVLSRKRVDETRRFSNKRISVVTFLGRDETNMRVYELLENVLALDGIESPSSEPLLPVSRTVGLESLLPADPTEIRILEPNVGIDVVTERFYFKIVQDVISHLEAAVQWFGNNGNAIKSPNVYTYMAIYATLLRVQGARLIWNTAESINQTGDGLEKDNVDIAYIADEVDALKRCLAKAGGSIFEQRSAYISGRKFQRKHPPPMEFVPKVLIIINASGGRQSIPITVDETCLEANKRQRLGK